MNIHQQHHGYLRGHQLLATSVKLDRTDQEVVDRLSDIAGQVQGDTELPSYLTGYPLPSGRYFVFARSWYDTEAHRSGCVLTHSLIITKSDWMTFSRPSSLQHLHTRFPHADQSGLLPIDLGHSFHGAPPASDFDAFPELVEALFLEDRQPILWIADNPQNAILRIVDSLWPALRGNFAFQTYALKPRSINDRPFDLVAVPRRARGRFANWTGRRIEGASAPRHAWTNQLSDEIFRAEQPDLRRIDPLGVLSSDTHGDPASLRMSLLWSDLNERAEHSAVATLGMLDILAASSLSERKIVPLLVPLVSRALATKVADEFPNGQAKFFTLLTNKLAKLPVAELLKEPLEVSIQDVFLSLPDEGAKLLRGSRAASDDFAGLTERAFVSALYKADASDQLVELLESTTGEQFARLIDRSPDLPELIVSRSHRAENFERHLSDCYGRLDVGTKAHLRTSLPGKITSNPLVDQLLAETDDSEFVDVADRLLSGNPERVSTLAQSLLNSRKAQPRIGLLRQLVRERQMPLTIKSALIAGGMRPTETEIAWLLDLQEPELALEVIDRGGWSDAKLASLVSRDEGRLTQLCRLFSSNGDLTRILKLIHGAKLPFTSKLEMAEPVFQETPPSREKDELIELFITAAFPIATAGDAEAAGRVLRLPGAAALLKQRSALALAKLLIPDLLPTPEGIKWTLQFLVSGVQKTDKVFAKSTAEITHRLVAAIGREHSEETFKSWALFLNTMAQYDSSSGLEAASESLEFAFSRQHWPASELVKSAVQIVYPVVKRDRRNISRGFFSAPIDRPTKLRQSLVTAYYYSTWPPQDLAIIAEALEIADKIYPLIKERWSGRRYLKDMFDGLDPKRSEIEKRARKHLRDYI